MSTPKDFKDLYTDELKDLWSANDQMKRLLKKVASKAENTELKAMLDDSEDGITAHTDLLKELIEGQDKKVSKEHCKGMEGLVAEATKHIIEEGPSKGPLLDALIVSQYQRMTHYGLAGFGTAVTYAKALGLKADVEKLDASVKEIRNGEKSSSKLAESISKNAKADA